MATAPVIRHSFAILMSMAYSVSRVCDGIRTQERAAYQTVTPNLAHTTRRTRRLACAAPRRPASLLRVSPLACKLSGGTLKLSWAPPASFVAGLTVSCWRRMLRIAGVLSLRIR